jgi:hypothetical protein
MRIDTKIARYLIENPVNLQYKLKVRIRSAMAYLPNFSCLAGVIESYLSLFVMAMVAYVQALPVNMYGSLYSTYAVLPLLLLDLYCLYLRLSTSTTSSPRTSARDVSIRRPSGIE